MSMRILWFTPTIGETKTEFPVEIFGSVTFQNVVAELAKKLQLNNESLALYPPGGSTLTYSDYNNTVDEIIEKYGDKFRIINRGVVG